VLSEKSLPNLLDLYQRKNVMNLLRVTEKDDGLVVYFAESKILDEGTILQVGKELMDVLVRATPKKKLTLDFERVQFMSSAMIGKLVFLNKKAKADAVDLRLRNIQPNVLEVFKLTRLNRVFQIDE
jgi:anti-sigma B factor antagonist